MVNDKCDGMKAVDIGSFHLLSSETPSYNNDLFSPSFSFCVKFLQPIKNTIKRLVILCFNCLHDWVRRLPRFPGFCEPNIREMSPIAPDAKNRPQSRE